MLRSADLITVSRVGFPKMETVFVQEVEGAPPVQIIKGLSKKPWMDFSGGKSQIGTLGRMTLDLARRVFFFESLLT